MEALFFSETLGFSMDYMELYPGKQKSSRQYLVVAKT
jgi:hypothetical protein